ncbi:MAG: isocitrate/isopropylmalate family dehydrogenase [Candidatus Sericytochromatia bacterium]|nr:isocitrate/isopropylmalate family dehydrogenase [Candidatus Sericytochromatia bacterium]
MRERTHRVAVLPGDATGPELMAQAVRVLKAAGERFGFAVDCREGLIGQAAILARGRALPPETLRLCRASEAVLVGPLAGAKHVPTPPSARPRQALITLRDMLGTFATVRPIRSFAGLRGVGALDCGSHPINLVVVHDHTSGLFYGRPRGIVSQGEEEVATNTMVYTTGEIARVAHLACQVAATRARRVLLIDQAKQLDVGRLWARTFEAVGAAHPGITLARRDAAHFFFELVNRPEAYDVLVTEMSLGHLVCAAATGLTGAFALHPEASVGGAVSVFQPSHGSAPHLVGQHQADPIGMIRAGALMLAWAFQEQAAAEAIEQAVAAVLAEGLWPAELAGAGGGRAVRVLGTEAMGEAVIQRLPPAVTTGHDEAPASAMLREQGVPPGGQTRDA